MFEDDDDFDLEYINRLESFSDENGSIATPVIFNEEDFSEEFDCPAVDEDFGQKQKVVMSTQNLNLKSFGNNLSHAFPLSPVDSSFQPSAFGDGKRRRHVQKGNNSKKKVRLFPGPAGILPRVQSGDM